MPVEHAPVAVSMGDPCGIGPDVILHAWHRRQTDGAPSDYFVVGSIEVLRARAKLLNLDINFSDMVPGEPLENTSLNVLDLGMPAPSVPGQPTDDDARIAIAAIETSVKLIHQGQASALATAPINKEVLYRVGFDYPGHTEFLGALCKQHWGKDYLPVMMLAGPSLRTVPVTIHVPISDVPKVLTEELIIQTVRIVHEDLQARFSIKKPRITVTGLNPHAGEQGTIGTAELDVIGPALEQLRATGISAKGPVPADSVFHAEARKECDAIICMYHDQALIPAKMLNFHEAVNVTLGLPIIRTSPDHGTAYDIAGTGRANPSSYIEALKMAETMATNS